MSLTAFIIYERFSVLSSQFSVLRDTPVAFTENGKLGTGNWDLRTHSGNAETESTLNTAVPAS
jgi:hypothetical protein